MQIIFLLVTKTSDVRVYDPRLSCISPFKVDQKLERQENIFTFDDDDEDNDEESEQDYNSKVRFTTARKGYVFWDIHVQRWLTLLYPPACAMLLWNFGWTAFLG